MQGPEGIFTFCNDRMPESLSAARCFSSASSTPEGRGRPLMPAAGSDPTPFETVVPAPITSCCRSEADGDRSQLRWPKSGDEFGTSKRRISPLEGVGDKKIRPKCGVIPVSGVVSVGVESGDVPCLKHAFAILESSAASLLRRS